MQLRHEGYGALLTTDDGAQVSLGPAELREFLTELPEFAYDFHLTEAVLDAFGETALEDSLTAKGAEVVWGKHLTDPDLP